MKNFLSIVLVAVAIITSYTGTGFAGAWTAKQNNFYEKLAFNFYYSTDTFNANGSRHGTPNNGKFTDYNISNYFEYGLLDNLTIINSLTYKRLENENNTAITRGDGLGDVDLGLRYKFLDSDKVGIFSTQALLKIPGAYSKNDALPLGNGQFDFEMKLMYGRSLYPWIPGYGNIEFGYRWRAQDPSDEFRYLIEFGLDITKNFYTRVKLDGIMSVDNGKKADSNGNPTATNNYDLGKLDLALGYKVAPNWGIEASYVPEVFGQNTAAGSTYTLAVYFKSP
jgi:hypothetical protein